MRECLASRIGPFGDDTIMKPLMSFAGNPAASLVLFLMGGSMALGADPAVLAPRVPPAQREEAKTWQNPFPDTPAHLKQGKALFHGKGFCVTCHGKDGKGLGKIPGLRGKLPRDFTDQAWQAARTDGELFWILKNGSPGTDMASFIPLVLTEDEAWQIILYVRSFEQR